MIISRFYVDPVQNPTTSQSLRNIGLSPWAGPPLPASVHPQCEHVCPSQQSDYGWAESDLGQLRKGVSVRDTAMPIHAPSSVRARADLVDLAEREFAALYAMSNVHFDWYTFSPRPTLSVHVSPTLSGSSSFWFSDTPALTLYVRPSSQDCRQSRRSLLEEANSPSCRLMYVDGNGVVGRCLSTEENRRAENLDVNNTCIDG